MPITIATYPSEPANSYASLAFFKTRLDNQLRVYTGKSDDQLSAALIAATEYVDTRFSFVGYQKVKGQSLQWPRDWAVDARGDQIEGIPLALQRAVCEYAWRELNSPGVLLPDPVADSYGQQVKSRSETVGPLSESITYETANGQRLPTFPQADLLLFSAGLVRRTGGITVGTLGRS